MQEIIIVAGENKVDVYRLRRRLWKRGYASIPCKSAEQILEELEILPTCNVSVSLVIIEPVILDNLSEDSVGQLSEYSVEIPFLLFKETNTELYLTERFEKICEYRMRFRTEQNPDLARILGETGVEVVCN